MINGCDLALIEQIVGEGIANAASPGETFGRKGNVSSGTFLINQDVVSNKTGVPFGLLGGNILKLWVASKNINTYQVGIYHHLGDAINLTLIYTINVVATRNFYLDKTDFGNLLIPQNVQLAVRVDAGNVKHPKVRMFLGGF